ncbi:MAG: 2,3-bisphosphoglycerate-independent phosphoglycerate mutase [Saprospiraceae bacterium]|nr:2,3-bisphosphoglycerate-independent phosphoglycerate mutase [Saprospiraceae bacterium]
MLIVLDGWGIGQYPDADAIHKANTPHFDRLLREYPSSTLTTHGEAVGLPPGQMGNSEVGHLNLGAGRIVHQDLSLIDRAIARGELVHNPGLAALAAHCIDKDRPCHLVGLVSDGGVHSQLEHLFQLVESLQQLGVRKIFIHAITDGRDTDPHSGKAYLETLEKFLVGRTALIASLIGRYYAMDRDKRWERIRAAYSLLLHGTGHRFKTASAAIQDSYGRGVTDEFIDACKIGDPEEGLVRPGDGLLCFNFRTDRLRQLTEALSQEGFTKPEDLRALPLFYATMTRYDEKFRNVQVLFDSQHLSNTLGECLSRYGLSQLRIAETEKYPHVSFFFSGGREKPYSGERRRLIPSPKVATYDLQPEMSAREVTRTLLEEMETDCPDFVCLNFANADMVGHTGVFAAAVAAVETVDQCLEQITSAALAKDFAIIVLADHGNADYMINEDGSPNTAHTKNPVPCILLTPDKAQNSVRSGKLADIAPTLLELLGLPAPVEMTGNSLLIKTEVL